MDDAARARDAACEALADVEPDQLREALEDRIANAAVTPACWYSVTRAVDPPVDPDTVVDRAAGVQLIYDEGLRLTRSVAHEEPG